MRKLIVISTALMLSAAPAHAQLLGGGLGGAIGGTVGGTIGGTLGGAGSIGSSVDTIRSTTSGTLRGAGSTSGSQSVDRKSGKVHADRSASGSTAGEVSQATGTPARMINGNASAGAGGSGSGSLDAQLLGTDAVRGTVQTVRGAASGAASGALSTGRGLTSSVTGTLSGSGSATGSGSGSGTGSLDTVTGSGDASGSGNGGFQVTRGMPVLAPGGERIGKVRQLFTNGRGEVQQMLVKVGDSSALLPAANFSASGNGVMSAMTESQIKQTAAQQQANSNKNK
jgi:hypothetical protein